MDTSAPAVGIVAAVMVVGIVAVPLATSQSIGAIPGLQPQQQELPASCDYDVLYDETIGSVVQVSQNGGQGSGFVYQVADDGTGYVVTNQHVVANADEVVVTFSEGESQTGTVVGTDALADLAVVRVNQTPDYADALPVAEDVPDPGSKVAALGSPFGLEGTITHGIVSGVNRSMPTDRGFRVPNVIQTDAPINPGNSGGPLVTCNGTVAGVNTAGIQASRANNVGFAISASLVREVAPQLVETGEFDWPYLGVQTTAVTPAIAQANDLNTTQGVMVIETTEGGPSADVLQGYNTTEVIGGQVVPVGGDVIVSIGGQPVGSLEELASFLATDASPGDEVTVTVIRDGERTEVTVTLGERPSVTDTGMPS